MARRLLLLALPLVVLALAPSARPAVDVPPSAGVSLAVIPHARAALATTATARAAAPLIGMGEQKPGMFSDPRFHRLGVRDVRYVAPWDVLRDAGQRRRLDAWTQAARLEGRRILIGFQHSLRSRRLAHTLPTRAQFERQFRRVRARYPFVRNWIAWNEGNHPASLTAHRPRRAARFFDAIARNCRRCHIVAADVLDVSGMSAWIRAFRRHAVHRPRIWGLHNYGDTNRFTDKNTRALLAATRGKVWFTETGGLVLRREYKGRTVKREFRYSVRHAARATAQALRLACLSRRIRRVYFYHWRAPRPVTNWDSAFIGPRGRARPAYRTLRRELARGVRC
jgi:hypothetical protein